MKKYTLGFILILIVSFGCTQKSKFIPGKDFDLVEMIQPVPTENILEDSLWNIWCGSMAKGYDGKYHLFSSRWPRSFGHEAWITHSEITYAVADKPEGPYTFVNVSLAAHDSTAWDGAVAHNPCIVLYKGKYFLYYIGTHHEPERNERPSPYDEDWWTQRNTQRIGVAVADKPEGPWKRLNYPILTNNETDSTAFDAKCVTNPAVCVGRDGKIIMLYKAVEKDGTLKGGKVRFSVAIADKPEGPFIKTNKLIFQSEDKEAWMVAEDPYIWFDNDTYYALVCDIKGYFTGVRKGLALMQSQDALSWEPAPHPKVVGETLAFEDGSTIDVAKEGFERPCIYFDEKTGTPLLLFGATGIEKNGVYREHSINVRVPLKMVR